MTIEYTREVKQCIYPQYDRVLWQRGFHDWIFRNERELERARTLTITMRIPHPLGDVGRQHRWSPTFARRTVMASMPWAFTSFIVSGTVIGPPLGRSHRNSSASIRSSASGLLPRHVADMAHVPFSGAYRRKGGRGRYVMGVAGKRSSVPSGVPPVNTPPNSIITWSAR